jgi:hypothetical protein
MAAGNERPKAIGYVGVEFGFIIGDQALVVRYLDAKKSEGSLGDNLDDHIVSLHLNDERQGNFLFPVVGRYTEGGNLVAVTLELQHRVAHDYPEKVVGRHQWDHPARHATWKDPGKRLGGVVKEGDYPIGFVHVESGVITIVDSLCAELIKPIDVGCLRETDDQAFQVDLDDKGRAAGFLDYVHVYAPYDGYFRVQGLYQKGELIEMTVDLRTVYPPLKAEEPSQRT